jgi:acylphosphatase
MRLACAALNRARYSRKNITHTVTGCKKEKRKPEGSAKIAHSRPASKPSVREEKNARRYYVSGTVQGVGYRYFAERAAAELGITGYVRNLRDGRVEVYAIGPSDSLASLRDRLERGPIGSSVEKVTEEDATIDPDFQRGFSIEYDG